MAKILADCQVKREEAEKTLEAAKAAYEAVQEKYAGVIKS